jgi:hypothetical protein
MKTISTRTICTHKGRKRDLGFANISLLMLDQFCASKTLTVKTDYV